MSKAANPPAQRLLDMTEVIYNGPIKFDETFFTSLSRTLNEETLQPRDLQMMGMLLPLGIEKGEEDETPVRPLRHPFFTSTDLVCASGVPGALKSCHQLTA